MADWPFFSEPDLLVGDGQSVADNPRNTGKTEQAVFRNGGWVKFWSAPGMFGIQNYLKNSVPVVNSPAFLIPGSTGADSQCTVRVPETGHYFITQPHTESNGVLQSTRITRLTSAGVMMEQMVLNGAGHGTAIAVEVSGGVEYVWISWGQPTLTATSSDNPIVRFPWPSGVGTAGTRFDRSAVTGLTTPIPGPTYRNVQFDWVSGTAVLRIPSGATDLYQLHSLANILAGNISQPQHSITLIQSLNFGLDGNATSQGFASYGSSLFRYTGAPTDQLAVGGDGWALNEYDWATGITVNTINLNGLGSTGNGTFYGGKAEPEGASLTYTATGSNSANGGTVPKVLLTVVTGPPGDHKYALFDVPLNLATAALTPVANFTWVQGPPSTGTTTTTGTVVGADGLPVTTTTTTTYPVSFNGLASFEIGGRLVAWDWTFGDGGTASGSTVSYAYTGTGTFSVKLTVTDAVGTKVSITKPITTTAVPASQPVANFTPTVTGYTVAFDGSASISTNGASVVAWNWQFGDGTTGSGPTTSHTYAGGTYPVTLTVTDSLTHTGSATLRVATNNTAPVPSFAISSVSGLTVTVDASASKDPDGAIGSYGWDFGDGFQGTGKTATHTYRSNGTYPIQLTITDNLNTESTLTKSVTVAAPNANPIAVFTTSTNGLILNVDGSDSNDPNGEVVGWAWNWGDGSTGTGVLPSHTYASAGTRTVTLTVTDDLGATGTSSQSVTVAAGNTPPVPSFTTSVTGLVLTVNGSGSTDPGGSIAGYAWAFGDGGTASGATATHTYTTANSYTVKLTVTDNQGVAASTTKVVSVSKPATDYIIGAASGSSTLVPGSSSAVLQQLVRSPDTGEFYSSQVHAETNGFESVRISRMKSDGSLIDQMVLTDAGHGEAIGLEYSGGKIYIWLNWHRGTDNTTVVDDYVRFPYTSGTFTRSQVTGLTVKIAGPTYHLAAFDYRGGYGVVHVGGSPTYTRHTLANLQAGNLSAPLNTITIPESPPIQQGFATYYDSFFRYTGAASDGATRSTDAPAITEYSWVTGDVVRRIDTSSFGGTASRTEPEGLSIYNTGTNPVLFFSVTQGPSGGPHTYPTWWYPLFNPEPVTTPNPPPGPPPPPPPSGNTAKSPWQLGSETEGLPSSVRVVKWSSIATSSSDNNDPMVAINRLTAPSVIDISGEVLTIPSFGVQPSTNYWTGIGHRNLLGFIGGINNGVFDNQIRVKPNIFTSAQLSFTAGQARGTSTQYVLFRNSAGGWGTGYTAYMMGVHWVGADQQKVTEAVSGWQVNPGPARHAGLDYGHVGAGSIIQNTLIQGINYSDGSTPPWETGALNIYHTSGITVRRVEVDGIIPVGSLSRPSSSTVDPYGHGWKRSGGLQFSGDQNPRMFNVSLHSGLVSGLALSIAGHSNNGSNNTKDPEFHNTYVEDQSLHGFSGLNLEDVLGPIIMDHPTFKMNGTGGYHIKLNGRLRISSTDPAWAPNISAANFVITEPTWSGLGNNNMLSVGITGYPSQQGPPTVIKNGVHLTATTSTTADPARYFYVANLG